MLSWRAKEPTYTKTEAEKPSQVLSWRRNNENREEISRPIKTTGRINDWRTPNDRAIVAASDSPSRRPKIEKKLKLKIVRMLKNREDYLNRFLIYMLHHKPGYFQGDSNGFCATDDIIKHPNLVKRKVTVEDINRITYANKQYEWKEVGPNKYKLKLNLSYSGAEESVGVQECVVLAKKNMNLE